MRYLRVSGLTDLLFALTDDDAFRLEKAGIIDRCGDPSHGHEDDYHLNPEDTSPYGFEDVLEAIYNGRLVDAPTLESAGIETIKMEGVIARDIAMPMTAEALEKRAGFMQRNLALNAATTALKRGLFGTVAKMRQDEGMDVSVSMTVIPPGKHATFAWVAKKWVIGLIEKMPGVSDQRKDEVIALIKDA